MTPTAHTSKSDSELLREINERTIRIDTKLFGAATGDKGFIAETNSRLSSQHNRLTRVEIAIATATGALIILGFIVGNHLLSTGAIK